MLRFFKHNYIIQLVVIVLLAIITWIPMFLNLPKAPLTTSITTPLFNFFVGIFNFAPWIVTIIAFLVFLLSVFFINSMLTVNQLASRNSTFGSLMYIVCSSCVVISCDSYQFIFATPFILITMQTMYSLMQSENPEPYLFNVGFFVSLASMIYFPSIVLILWVLLVMMMFGYKVIRLYLIPLLAFITPYFIMLAIFYFNRRLPEMFESYSNGFLGIELQSIELSTRENIVMIVLAVLFVISFIKIKSSAVDNSIQTRKRLSVTLLLLLLSLFMMAMQKPNFSNGMIFMVLSVFYAMALSTVKKSKIADVLLVIVIVGALSVQYLPLFL